MSQLDPVGQDPGEPEPKLKSLIQRLLYRPPSPFNSDVPVLMPWEETEKNNEWLETDKSRVARDTYNWAAKELPKNESGKVAFFFNEGRYEPREAHVMLAKHLIAHIIWRQPHLQSHVADMFSTLGQDRVFDHPNDFYAMSVLFRSLVTDPGFERTYFVLGSSQLFWSDGENPGPPTLRRVGLRRGIMHFMVTSSSLDPLNVRWLYSWDSEEPPEAPYPNFPKGSINMVEDPYPSEAPGNENSLRRNPLIERARATLEHFAKADCRILGAVLVAYRPLLVSRLAAITDLPFENLDLELLSQSLGVLRFRDTIVEQFVREGISKPQLLQHHLAMAKGCLNLLLRNLRTAGGTSTAPEVRDADMSSSYETVYWIKHLSELEIDDMEALDLVRELLEEHLLLWLKTFNTPDLLNRVRDMMVKLSETIRARARSQSQPQRSKRRRMSSGGTDDTITRPLRLCKTMEDVVELMRLHVRWHSQDKRITLEDSLLFLPCENSVRGKYLSRVYPWLHVSPIPGRDDEPPYRIINQCHDPPDWPSPEEESERRAPPSIPPTVRFLGDGAIVESFSKGKHVRHWDVESGRLQYAFDLEGDYSGAVVYSSLEEVGYVGRIAAFNSSDVNVWELPSGKLRYTLSNWRDKIPAERKKADWKERPISRIAISEDRLAIAVGEAIAIVSMNSKTPNLDWRPAGGDVSSLKFVFGGKAWAASSRTSMIFGNSRTPRLGYTSKLSSSSERGPYIQSLSHPDELGIVASSWDDGTARISHNKTGKTRAVLDAFTDACWDPVSSSAVPIFLSFSSDGTCVAVGTPRGHVGVWKRPPSGNWEHDGGSLKPDQILYDGCYRHNSSVTDVALAPNGKVLATVFDNGEIHIWDLDGHKTSVNEDSFKPTSCLAVSLTGQLVASAGKAGVIRFWHSKTGEE
ncbi:quinon protein alcohol dehydrogenase-like superfamily [Xylariaceae sp. FL0594]|nr:quinon protein alcohol dehydrogenase-like superfamily [Xylariaceae sp. FL0594]